MYAGVPTLMPTCVSDSLCASLSALPMPKSATTAWPSCSRMFSGLMSRCTIVVAVRIVERVGDFARDAHGVGDRETLLARQAIAQRLALHDRHHVVEKPVRLAGVVERQDVRVSQPRREPDLAQESLAPERLRELRLEHLERDVAIVLEVVREVHGRHAAGAELALDAVAVGERRVQLVVGRGHRGAFALSS